MKLKLRRKLNKIKNQEEDFKLAVGWLWLLVFGIWQYLMKWNEKWEWRSNLFHFSPCHLMSSNGRSDGCGDESRIRILMSCIIFCVQSTKYSEKKLVVIKKSVKWALIVSFPFVLFHSHCLCNITSTLYSSTSPPPSFPSIVSSSSHLISSCSSSSSCSCFVLGRFTMNTI